MVKNLPAIQETWVRILGQEDPLEKGMATHYSILAWRIPWTEEPGGLQSTGSQRVGYPDLSPLPSPDHFSEGEGILPDSRMQIDSISKVVFWVE